MTQVSRWRPSPATAISCLALFVALSGSAVALQGRNTVASDDIKPKAVKRSDIALNAINSSRVANGSLRIADFGDQLPQGEQGPPGPPGPPGSPGGGGGAPGPNSITANELGTVTAIFSGSPTTINGVADNNVWSGSGSTDTASCGAGQQLLSGYIDWITLAGGEELATVEVELDPVGGSVTVRGIHDEASEQYRAVALCLN